MSGMLREWLEERERHWLSPHAAFAYASRGRQRAEPEHAYRTAFQRDRDRILHTKAFRRLKRKTQVFLAPEGDHYRTRLTHTLEVAQIARTVARALQLNEDLTEAIALGHDLGHTPFGHAGESVLNEVLPGGFQHSEQSLRIVDKLESTGGHPGLNLTEEVRDGIRHHSKGKAILFNLQGERAFTLEGQIVSVCDAIAYVNHDIDDAIRGGIITDRDLPTGAVAIVGSTSSRRIDTMVTALIEGSSDGVLAMEENVRAAMVALREYLYRSVYPSPAIRTEIEKAKKLLREMYAYLVEQRREDLLRGDPEDSLERRAADFIASMTDDYALQLYNSLFLPRAWPV